jgi:hypothetical protein
MRTKTTEIPEVDFWIFLLTLRIWRDFHCAIIPFQDCPATILFAFLQVTYYHFSVFVKIPALSPSLLFFYQSFSDRFLEIFFILKICRFSFSFFCFLLILHEKVEDYDCIFMSMISVMWKYMEEDRFSWSSWSTAVSCPIDTIFSSV